MSEHTVKKIKNGKGSIVFIAPVIVVKIILPDLGKVK